MWYAKLQMGLFCRCSFFLAGGGGQLLVGRKCTLERFSLDCRIGIGFGFGFGLTTSFGWLVYLLWFWFYDSQVKTTLYGKHL